MAIFPAITASVPSRLDGRATGAESESNSVLGSSRAAILTPEMPARARRAIFRHRIPAQELLFTALFARRPHLRRDLLDFAAAEARKIESQTVQWGHNPPEARMSTGRLCL